MPNQKERNRVWGKIQALRREIDALYESLYPGITRDMIYFVTKDGVAHPAVDWAEDLRRKRLPEYFRTPTHAAPSQKN